MVRDLLLFSAMSQPRVVLPDSTVFVSRRTLRRHHLFRPDAEMTQLYLYALAVCARKYSLLVHAVVLMSTHEHFVATDVRGVLPEFLQDFHRLIALGTKALRKWEGSVWDSGRPSVVRLLSREAIVEKIAYCMANPVAAGLVREARAWPGVTTQVSDLGTKVFRAKRPSFFFDEDNAQWPEEAELALTLPTMPESDCSAEEFRSGVAEELGRLESEARAEAREKGRSFLGRERVLAVSPYRRAKSFEEIRQLNPTFAVGRGNKELRLSVIQELREFRDHYRAALERWREGLRTLFPPGTWWMHFFHGAPVGSLL